MPDSTARMPAVFFGHGSPMNALAQNQYTQAWRRLGDSVPRPKAILAISAHWYTPGTAVTAMENPRPSMISAGSRKRCSTFNTPTPEHFLPLLCILGLQDDQDSIAFPLDDIQNSSIGMLTLVVGADSKSH